jgi:hypothetical protein
MLSLQSAENESKQMARMRAGGGAEEEEEERKQVRRGGAWVRTACVWRSATLERLQQRCNKSLQCVSRILRGSPTLKSRKRERQTRGRERERHGGTHGETEATLRETDASSKTNAHATELLVRSRRLRVRSRQCHRQREAEPVRRELAIE